MSSSSSSIVRTPDIISRWCRVMHDTHGLTDRQIALKPYFSGIPAGTINTIRKHGAVPQKWHRKLRIRCPRCGRYSHEYDCSIEKPVPVEAETYNPATYALRRKAPRKPQVARTPGGWVNAKDPQRAARQIVGRAEYGIGELIEWLEIEREKKHV